MGTRRFDRSEAWGEGVLLDRFFEGALRAMVAGAVPPAVPLSSGLQGGASFHGKILAERTASAFHWPASMLE